MAAEEGQGGYCSYQINIMKLALALVIVKRKPPGISAKEYATKLAVSFSQAQANWKSKYLVIEKELIYVRQKLLETKLEKEPESVTNDESSSKDMATPQLMDSQSQGYCSYTQPQEADNVKLDSDGGSQESIIHSHICFMNKMSKIINIKKKLSGITHCDAMVIMRDTFMDTIKALQAQDISTTVPSAVITDAVECIVGIMKSQLFVDCQEEMVDCVGQLQNKFITKLSNNFNTDLWNKNVTETLCTVILNLSTITELTKSTVTILVKHIRACAKMLNDSLTDITLLKPSVLDFTAKVFQLLESVLKQCQPDELDEIRDIVLNEDEGLPTLLSDQYPLFTYSVWKISAIVNARCYK